MPLVVTKVGASEHEASLTLVNASFRNVPVAIDIDPDSSDWLWVKNSRFENVSKAAVIVSNENGLGIIVVHGESAVCFVETGAVGKSMRKIVCLVFDSHSMMPP